MPAGRGQQADADADYDGGGDDTPYNQRARAHVVVPADHQGGAIDHPATYLISDEFRAYAKQLHDNAVPSTYFDTGTGVPDDPAADDGDVPGGDDG